MQNSQGKFSVKFRGVRGSYPTPDFQYLKYGGNTSCVEVNVNGHLILLDAGTGIIKKGNELLKDYIASNKEDDYLDATILLSHFHQDHIQGLPFFKPLYMKNALINIVGSSAYEEEIDEVLSNLLFQKSFPLDLTEIAADVNFVNLNDNYILVFKDDTEVPEIMKIESDYDYVPEGDEVVISCLKSNAHPKTGVLIYKIAYKDRSLVYATDKESYVGGDKKLALFARNADLLIHDSQYTTEEYLNVIVSKQGYGHSTFDMALEAMGQCHAKSLAFFHLDPNYNDDMLQEIENHYNKTCPTVFIPKEGQEIVLL